MSRPFRLLAVGAATGALLLGTAGAASAATTAAPTAPTAPGGAYRGLDTVADGLVCGGPLRGLLGQLVDCDPEDEPPFTSVPDGGS